MAVSYKIPKIDYLCSMETITLDNGLRIVCAPSPTNVVYCGVAVDAGTRDELPGEEGLAHFIEHMTFKGTERRRSWHILNRMEAVGGDLNAFTSKEETVYHCTFLKEHFARAVDLLFDVVLHSTYPQSEMDKEVEVVIDEIESYNDSPSELIYDEFEQLLFGEHPLGHNILGEADRLRQFTTDDMRRFVDRHYTLDRMVFFVMGDVDMQTILREVKKATSGVGKVISGQDRTATSGVDRIATSGVEKAASGERKSLPMTIIPGQGQVVQDKSTHQAHVMMGTLGYAASDPRHLHLSLLNNILGGPGMNARFNLVLRERNGLVYTVESNSTCYTDNGVWSVYFGCDPHDVKRCQRLIMKELEKLVRQPLTASELSAAKRQIIGQIGVSYDSFESVAIGMGKRFLHYNLTQTCQQLCDSIMALTADELWQTAREVFDPSRIRTLIYQ